MPSSEVLIQFLNVSRKVERRVDSALSNVRGIRYTEFQMLSALSKMHEGTGMRIELANRVGLTASAITRALRPLEKLGYVKSTKCPRDARRSLVTLTDAGFELVADSQGVIRDMANQLSLNGLKPSTIKKFLDGMA